MSRIEIINGTQTIFVDASLGRGEHKVSKLLVDGGVVASVTVENLASAGFDFRPFFMSWLPVMTHTAQDPYGAFERAVEWVKRHPEWTPHCHHRSRYGAITWLDRVTTTRSGTQAFISSSFRRGYNPLPLLRDYYNCPIRYISPDRIRIFTRSPSEYNIN